MRRAALATIAALLVLFTGEAAYPSDFWNRMQNVLTTPDTATGASPLATVYRAMRGYTEEEELSIGREAAGRLLGAAPLVADPALQLYVNRVGRWVAAQGERPDLPWRFGVIGSDDINAFAAPGGFVFITAGLYRTLKNESELAGVLAHEIAHVIRKHHLKLLQQERLLDVGGRVLSREAGDTRIQQIIGTGAELFARSLDRDAEYEADRMALVLAVRAGYDPFGLPIVLDQIGHASAGDDRVALLFSTHPAPADRLAQIDAAIGDRLDKIPGKTGRKVIAIK